MKRTLRYLIFCISILVSTGWFLLEAFDFSLTNGQEGIDPMWALILWSIDMLFHVWLGNLLLKVDDKERAKAGYIARHGGH